MQGDKNKKKLYLKTIDFYDEENEEAFWRHDFIQILAKKYDVIYSENPDFLICGNARENAILYDCVKILWCGEAVSPNFNIYDYVIGLDFLDFGERYTRVNTWATHCGFADENEYDLNNKNAKILPIFTRHLSQNWNLENRNKFCSFMITNAAGNDFTPRIDFFKKLCEYKKVDSGGKALNNIGGAIGSRGDDFTISKRNWLKNYKFNICFENASYPGYLTEKLWDAFGAGCIPIYWGDTSLRCDLDLQSQKYIESKYIESKQEDSIKVKINNKIPNIKKEFLPPFRLNPKAFINVHNYSSFNDVIEEIKRIDNDQKTYEEMLAEPVFLNNFSAEDLKKYNYDRIMDFLYNIFEQEPENAKRRVEGQAIQDIIINKQKLSSLFNCAKINYNFLAKYYKRHPYTTIFKIIFRLIKYNSKLREFCLKYKIKQ